MENAQLYSSANGMQRRDAEEVIKEFCDALKWTDGARILDIGCGTGEVTAAILLPQLPVGFAELTGLDVSSEMIQYARKVHNHPKVTFVQFDIAREAEDILDELNRKLKTLENNNLDTESEWMIKSVRREVKVPMNDRKIVNETTNDADVEFRIIRKGYDLISSFYCLHWIHNQRLALANIHRLLNPGGEALLVLLAKSPIFSLYDRMSKYSMWKKYMQDVDNFISPYHKSENPLKDFEALITDVGFAKIKSECRERNYIFQSISGLRNAIIAVNPFISRIPNHLRGQFISDCLKEVGELRLAEFKNNSHKVTYKLLVAHMRKPEMY